MKKKVTIGSRGSQLALWQTRFIKGELEKNHPGLAVGVTIIKTTGDKILDTPLAKIGDKGLFVKELEEALLDGSIDLAVHSMKDVPTSLPDGLCIGAIGKREDHRDAFISRQGKTLAELADGGHIGTSSLRRKSQLLAYAPQLRLTDLRGNLNTRLARVEQGDFDATILAVAGVKRLGWEDKITEIIPGDIMLSAVGQGALGIEVRTADQETAALIACLDHPTTHRSLTAERAMMAALEGGCQIPIGAYCQEQTDGTLLIQGVIGAVDGSRILRAELHGFDPVQLGHGLAADLTAQGAREILAAIR